MNLPTISIQHLSEVINLLFVYPPEYWIYRGQARMDWPLIPSAGRDRFFLPQINKSAFDNLPARDIGRFRRWRDLAIAYDRNLPVNDYECLAYAQHYGLATRLMDWSRNPLVGLFFAVEGCTRESGALYMYSPGRHLENDGFALGECPIVVQYSPPPFDQRILAQSGVFTYHPEPNVPLSAEEASVELGEMRPDHGKNLVQITFDARTKLLLKKQLNSIGVNRKALFPDLDGLSGFVNWETERAVRNHRNFGDSSARDA